MPAININQLPDDCYVTITTFGYNNDIYVFYSAKNGKSYDLDGRKLGQVIIEPSKSNNTGMIYEVCYSKTQSGYGPLLYDIAIEYVNKLTGGKGYLKCDPETVSAAARRVWDTFYKRSDIKHDQLDSLENELTRTPVDNVDMRSAKEVYRKKWASSALAQGYQKNIEILNSDKIIMKENKRTTIEFLLTESLDDSLNRIDKPRVYSELMKNYLQMEEGERVTKLLSNSNNFITYAKRDIRNQVQQFPDRLATILANWLITRLVKKTVLWDDAMGAAEVFDNFYKYIDKIKQKDINTYNNLHEIVNAYFLLDEMNFGLDRPKEVSDTKVIYEDEDWLIITPLTIRASCILGKDTEWCTAYDPEEHDNFFEEYNEDGPLFICFEKWSGKRFQYHQQRNEIKNTENNNVFNIDLLKILGKLNLLEGSIETLPNGGVEIISFDEYNCRIIRYYDKNDRLHSLDGPAVSSIDETKYMINGYEITDQNEWIEEGGDPKDGPDPEWEFSKNKRELEDFDNIIYNFQEIKFLFKRYEIPDKYQQGIYKQIIKANDNIPFESKSEVIGSVEETCTDIREFLKNPEKHKYLDKYLDESRIKMIQFILN